MFSYDYSYLSVLTIIKDAADNTIVKTAALVALIDSYANKEAERILITNFSDSVAEEKQLNFLEHKLLNLFDALKFEQFKKENGTTFRFGTFFDSDGDPIYIHYSRVRILYRRGREIQGTFRSSNGRCMLVVVQ